MVSVGVYFAEYVYVPALEIAVLELDHAHEPIGSSKAFVFISLSVYPAKTAQAESRGECIRAMPRRRLSKRRFIPQRY